MESFAPVSNVLEASTNRLFNNSTLNATQDGVHAATISADHLPRSLIRPILATLLVGLVIQRCIRYFTSDLPAWRSGLKPLPGPRSTLPYVGRVHDVDRMHAWRAMKKFSDQYDGLFSCTLGGETHIWVAREEIAQDLLCKNAAISSARGDLGAFPGVTKDFKYLPLLGYTDHLVRQRKFAHTITTRNVKNNFYGYIDLEAKRFMHELLERPNDIHDLIHLFCGRVTSRLAYGSDESAPKHVWNAGTFINQLGPSGPVTNLLPFLRYLPEWIIRDKKGVRIRQEIEASLWTSLFDETKEKVGRPGQPATYVDASLRAKDGDHDGKPLFENETEAKFAVGMMCIVAIYTIGGPATVFVLAMVLHSEWQEKVRSQIDQVVGDGMVELKHSPQLPVLRAAIKECVRWQSTVPLGVPRLLEKDYSYDGYHFPKHAVVHILDIALSRDPERYDDPDSYNPGRWLDETSPNFKSPLTEHPRLKGHHIFGRGKRVCPGQDLAEAELFVLCGNLVKFFTLSPKLNEKGEPMLPSPDNWGTDVIGGPLPFDCDIKIRDQSRLAMVKRLYQNEFATKI